MVVKTAWSQALVQKNEGDTPAQFSAYPNFHFKIISSLEQLKLVLTLDSCLYRVILFVLLGRHSLMFKNKS